MLNRAAKHTRVGINETAQVIESDRSITVFGVVATNTNTAEAAAQFVTLLDKNGVTIQDIGLASGKTEQMSFTWLADAGLRVTTGSNCTCTIYHSQGGA